MIFVMISGSHVSVSLVGRTGESVSFVVGSVKVNFFSYRYKADISTIFGMRGLCGLIVIEISIGRP